MAVAILLTLVMAGGLTCVGAQNTCAASSEISMSAGFLPAALAALSPTGVGSCSSANTTCSSPLGACPTSTCCRDPEGPRGGSCGCLTNFNGVETCSDPNALVLDLVACNPDGKRSKNKIEISFLSLGAECEESITVTQILNSHGKPETQINAVLCNKHRININFPGLKLKVVIGPLNGLLRK